MADNATLARSLYDAFNDRDFERMVALTATDVTITVVGSGDTYHGPDGVRRYNTIWAEAFPDGTITIDRVVASGDYAVVEFTGRGTQTGTLATPAGAIPATGRSVTLQLCDVLELSDGRLRAQRTYFDSGSLLAQLGIAATQETKTQK
jgi:steroid delta-isomerase-like uncharacterized protein